MSVGSELDVDVQDLVALISKASAELEAAGAVHEDERLDIRADVLALLLRMGWLPPTYTEHVKAKVKQAWEAVEDDESFKALQGAADVLGVELVDPMADPLNPVTLNSMTLGKVA